MTSQLSATAIATIPSFSQADGVTADSNTPSVTQLSAERIAAAASPASEVRESQAITNSGIAASDAHGVAPRDAQPSAPAASGGTAMSARYVSPVAVSET